MPRCRSLVNDAHLARIRAAPVAKIIRIVTASDYGDGLHILEIEGECVPAGGQDMKVIIIEGDTLRFSDDLDT